MRLDRHGVRHVGEVSALNDLVGLGEALRNVALGDVDVGGVVALPHRALLRRIRLPGGVHKRCLRFERNFGVEHRVQRLVVDLDERAGLLGELGRQCGDCGDHFAFVADNVLREQRSVLNRRAILNVWDVLLRDHGQNAGKFACLARVQPRDARIRTSGVEKRAVKHPGKRQVGRVAAFAVHLLEPVGPDEPFCRSSCHGASSPSPRRLGSCRQPRASPTDSRPQSHSQAPVVVYAAHVSPVRSCHVAWMRREQIRAPLMCSNRVREPLRVRRCEPLRVRRYQRPRTPSRLL